MIVNCTIMHLRKNEALHYLKSNRHEISRMTYYRVKRRVEQKKLARIVGPEGSGRKNFKMKTQCNHKVGPRDLGPTCKEFNMPAQRLYSGWYHRL
jgi:hypothetical protein